MKPTWNVGVFVLSVCIGVSILMGTATLSYVGCSEQRLDERARELESEKKRIQQQHCDFMEEINEKTVKMIEMIGRPEDRIDLLEILEKSRKRAGCN